MVSVTAETHRLAVESGRSAAPVQPRRVLPEVTSTQSLLAREVDITTAIILAGVLRTRCARLNPTRQPGVPVEDQGLLLPEAAAAAEAVPRCVPSPVAEAIDGWVYMDEGPGPSFFPKGYFT